MFSHSKYEPSSLQEAARRLGFFENETLETQLPYGQLPVRGSTHLDIEKFIGCGSWFSDLFDEDTLFKECTDSDDSSDCDDGAYQKFVSKLKKRARAKFPRRFATPAEIMGFLNEEAPQAGPPGVLPEPLEGLDDFLQEHLDTNWVRYSLRVETQLAKMDADLKDLASKFEARKRKWEEDVCPNACKKARKE